MLKEYEVNYKQNPLVIHAEVFKGDESGRFYKGLADTVQIFKVYIGEWEITNIATPEQLDEIEELILNK